MPKMTPRHPIRVLAGAVVLLSSVGLFGGVAGATTTCSTTTGYSSCSAAAQVDLDAGSLTIEAPASLPWGNLTLTGYNQHDEKTLGVTVVNATGSGGGWRAEAKMTRLGTGFATGESQVSAETRTTCATTSAGHVYCWGYNGYGQLGNDTTTTKRLPVEADTPAGSGVLSSVTQVSEGHYTTCATTSAGHLYCWGKNTSGQLGNDTTTQEDLPIEVKTPTGSGVLSTAAQVRDGYHTTCATTSTKHVYCWGYNASGQLGNDTTTQEDLPVEVMTPTGSEALSTVTQVSAGYTSTCTTTSTDHAYCWGNNGYGQLGNDTTTTASSTTAPTASCASGSACLLPTPTPLSFPFSVPTGTSTPTPGVFYSAASTTGLGGISLPLAAWLKVPGNALAGTYSATLVLSVVTGP